MTEFRASVFIDATYEGDLYGLAGVPFAVGRESRAQYGEINAGKVGAKRKTHEQLRDTF